MDVHKLAWGAAFLIAIADIATTVAGMGLGLQEMNPLVADGGFLALVLLKGVALGIGVSAYHWMDSHRLMVPAIFVAIWGPAALSNLIQILYII